MKFSTNIIEKLEDRRLLAIAITGNDAHAGILVDVRDTNGIVVGTANIDYSGWGGSGGSDNGNPITGADGKITVAYTPNSTVSGLMKDSPDRIVDGGWAGDKRIASWLKKETNGTVDLDQLANDNTVISFTVNACCAFATYFVWDTNCFNFADEAIKQESGYPMDATSCTWDGLMNDLKAAKNWLKIHSVRKVLPVQNDMKIREIRDFLDKQQ